MRSNREKWEKSKIKTTFLRTKPQHAANIPHPARNGEIFLDETNDFLGQVKRQTLADFYTHFLPRLNRSISTQCE